MNNPYKCPTSVYNAMLTCVKRLVISDGEIMPLLPAVKALGPKRVQWLGTNPIIKNTANGPTCWALDGKRATHDELLATARQVIEA